MEGKEYENEFVRLNGVSIPFEVREDLKLIAERKSYSSLSAYLRPILRLLAQRELNKLKIKPYSEREKSKI